MTKRLFPQWVLWLLVAAIAVILWLLYPRQDSALTQSTINAEDLKKQFSNPLHAQYVQLTSKQDVSAKALLDLANTMTEKGFWHQSNELLAQAKQKQLTDAQQQQLAQLSLKNRLSLYYLADSKGENVDPQWLQVRSELLLQDTLPHSNLELEKLAKQSVDFHLYPQASTLYEQLASQSEQPTKWLAESAKWAQKANNPFRAETLLGQAWEKADTQEKPVYKLAWLKAALAAGKQEEVNAYLEQAGESLDADNQDLEKLADISLKVARPEIAAEIYRALAEQQPDEAGRWYEKAGHWSNEAQLYQQAVDDWKQAIIHQPEQTTHFQTKQVDALLNDQQPQAALTLIKGLVDPDAATPLLEKGIVAALATQDTATARQWNQSLLEQQPDNQEALSRQVDIESLDKNYNEAIKYLKQLVKLNPSAKNHERWAYLSASAGDHKKALRLWQWLAENHPSDEYNKQLLSAAQAALNQGGLPILLQAAKQQALPEQAVHDVFNELQKQNRKAEAGQFLKDYLARYPKHSSHWLALAQWQASQKQYPQALDTFRQMRQHFAWTLKLQKAQDQVASDYFFALSEQKSPQAGVFLTQYLQVAPNNRKLWQALAQWQADQKQFQQALNTWQYIEQRFGQNAVSKKALGDLAKVLFASPAQGSVPAQTLASLQAYLSKNPHDESAWESLVQAQIAKKQYPQAIESLATMQQRFGQDGERALLQMQLHWELKQADQAYAALRPVYKPLKIATDYQVSIMAELAWQRENWEQAETIYKVLVQREQKQAPLKTAYYRLALAQINQGQDQAGIQTLQRGVQRIADQSLILDAMQFALDKKKTPLLQSLFQVAQTLKPTMNQPQFWRIAVALVEQLGDQPEASHIAQSILAMPAHTPELKEVKQGFAFAHLLQLQEQGNVQAFNQLRKQLEQDLSDPKALARLYDIALSESIDKKNHALTDALFARAMQRQVALPTWIKVVVALRQKNKPLLTQLVDGGAKMSLGDRFSALVALERKDEAFNFAHRMSKQAKKPKEREQARTLALSLAAGRVPETKASFSTREMGNDLSIQTQALSYHHPAKQGKPAIDVEIKRHQLKGHNGLPSQQETDVAARLRWEKEKHKLAVTGGLNRRGSDTKPYASIRYQQQITPKTSGMIEYGKQEVATENAWLRSHGQRDRLQGRVSTKITDKQTVEVSAWDSRFSQRSNDQKLANTQGASATWVYRDNVGDVSWYAGLQGTTEKTSYKEGLTQSQRNGLPSDGTSTTILAGFNRGSPHNGVMPQGDNLHYNVSAAVGKQWKTGQMTRRVDASVGRRLTENDELSVTAFYDQTGDQAADQGVGLQYRRWSGF